MARVVKPLSPAKCDAHRYSLEGGNKLSDGGGLYLEAMSTGRRSWRMKYIRPDGKEDRLVLGDYPAVGLKAARDEREKAKALLAAGIDPKAQRKEDELARQFAQDNTFEAVARRWHGREKAHWKPIHADSVMRRLELHAFPTIGRKPITSLKTRDLALVLDKASKASTPAVAQRVQWAIAGAFRMASQEGVIENNPAHDLTGYVKVGKGAHHPALPLEQLPDFMARIDDCEAKLQTRLAVKLSMLVFIRNSELRFARWSEINWDRAEWVIPGQRDEIKGAKHSDRGAKMGEDHYVPLSRQALEVLQKIHALTGRQELLFPGERKGGKPMSENTINAAFRRMGYDTRKDVCLHGLRTMACNALTSSDLWSRDAVERQMSHKERNGVRAAYTHMTEFLQQRRLMMQWWADYLDANRQQHVTPYDYAHPKDEKVVEIKRA